MANLLNDHEIKKILGSIIGDGDENSVRPNSYVLRLGNAGEFLTTGKEFRLGSGSNDKQGIKVAPGQSVAVTALETIDFTRDTVQRHFPAAAPELHDVGGKNAYAANWYVCQDFNSGNTSSANNRKLFSDCSVVRPP